MIYFLYGPDTYRSRRKLAEIISAFRQKGGSELEVMRLDGQDEPGALLAAGRSASLFSRRQFMLIERASQAPEAHPHLRAYLPAWRADPATIVIFWEGAMIPHTDPFFKDVIAQATQAQEFKALAPAAAGRWIEREAAAREIRLTPAECGLLLGRFGPDLWAIVNELDKMRSGWAPAAAGDEEAVWGFGDAFFGQRRRAFAPLSRLLAAGFEPIQLIGVLAGALRTLALVWQGMRAGRLRALTAGLNPYAVKKSTGIARMQSSATLSGFFDALLSADEEIKTGILPPPLPLVKLTLKSDANTRMARE